MPVRSSLWFFERVSATTNLQMRCSRLVKSRFFAPMEPPLVIWLFSILVVYLMGLHSIIPLNISENFSLDWPYNILLAYKALLVMLYSNQLFSFSRSSLFLKWCPNTGLVLRKTKNTNYGSYEMALKSCCLFHTFVLQWCAILVWLCLFFSFG